MKIKSRRLRIRHEPLDNASMHRREHERLLKRGIYTWPWGKWRACEPSGQPDYRYPCCASHPCLRVKA